jgi:hypothetical protein
MIIITFILLLIRSNLFSLKFLSQFFWQCFCCLHFSLNLKPKKHVGFGGGGGGGVCKKIKKKKKNKNHKKKPKAAGEANF